MWCMLLKTWKGTSSLPSVSGWRKDEFQWMSLALVGDRKGIWPQNLSTNYPDGVYDPSLLSLLLSEKDVVGLGWCYQDVWRRRVGDRITQVCLEGRPMCVCMCIRGDFLAFAMTCYVLSWMLNSAHSLITLCKSVSTFKRQLKTHLFRLT